MDGPARTEVNTVPTAAPQPSQEEMLEAALAALTEADVPPRQDEPCWSDPDTGRPAELASLTTAELEQLIAAVPAPAPEVIPAGCLPRDGTGRGAGFADGGALDVLVPGVPLAGFADEAQARLSAVSDDETSDAVWCQAAVASVALAGLGKAVFSS